MEKNLNFEKTGAILAGVGQKKFCGRVSPFAAET
jgi:hypothetical protein